MKTKKLVKNIICLVVIEAIVCAAILFVSSLAGGRDKKSSNLNFNIDKSMITENTEYITVFEYGSGETEIEEPKMDNYYCMNKTPVSELSYGNGIYQLEFTEEQTKKLESEKDADIIIAFADKNSSIIMNSADIRLETIKFIRSVSSIELKNTGIEVHYMYKVETITAVAMLLTLIFYISHVTKKSEETDSEAKKEEQKA